ncbi:MAG: DUF7681 family protein [Gemmatimonadaceae bacterium]
MIFYTLRSHPMREFDIEHVFTHHAPTAEQGQQYHEIREAGKGLAQAIVDHTPKSADQSAALRKVREAVMTANAAIALDGRLEV